MEALMTGGIIGSLFLFILPLLMIIAFFVGIARLHMIRRDANQNAKALHHVLVEIRDSIRAGNQAMIDKRQV